MTLYRQIAIIVALVLLILVSITLVIFLNVVKKSAQEELYNNAQNAVSSLAISLSNTNVDQNSIETIINASFDNGNYERITFTNMENEKLYERVKDIKTKEIPQWFRKVVHFQIDSAKATVSNGWNVVATLEILNDVDVIYMQLYTIMKNILISLSVVIIVSFILLSFTFKKLLKPLRKIEKQAKSVLNNEFVIQKELPFTKEFKAVVQSTNAMIIKFETIFKTASDTLKENKELLYNDVVMQIPNRRYFALKMTEDLTGDNGKNYGSVIAIFIQKTDILNKIIGYKQTDEFLFNFAQYLKQETQKFDDSFICRVNGTEIAIVLPKIDKEETLNIMQNIITYVRERFDQHNLNKDEFGISIGSFEYEPQHNLNKVFSLLDYTLSQSKLLVQDEYYVLENNKVAIAKEKWKKIIADGLEKDNFKIIYRKAIDLKNKAKNHDIISFSLEDENKETYYYGILIAPVVELGMIENVYIYIIRKILLSKEDLNDYISVQISSQFLEDKHTYEKLKILFEDVKRKARNKIIFEIPESALNKDFENCMKFIKLFKEYGFEFGINSFMAYSDNYDYLKSIKPFFVKADEKYILDAQQNINILKIVLDSIGVEFIATGVSEVGNIENLKQKGVNIIAGSVVDKI